MNTFKIRRRKKELVVKKVILGKTKLSNVFFPFINDV
jgi:hypothetical protein